MCHINLIPKVSAVYTFSHFNASGHGLLDMYIRVLSLCMVVSSMISSCTG